MLLTAAVTYRRAVEPALDLRIAAVLVRCRGGLAWPSNCNGNGCYEAGAHTSGRLQKVVAIASRALLECANDAWM